jgi:hypothetical protein
MSTKLTSLVLGSVVGLLAVPSCDLNVPDLNNPGLDELQDNPTPNKVNAAATGLLVGNRGGKTAATGLVNQLGVLGRESYDFDPNDGRFVSELIRGTLQKASPFGGVFWAGNYTNIRTGNVILHALDKLAVFDTAANVDAQKSAMKGFVHTIQAMEFEVIYLTHFDTGAPIDVDHPLGEPLGPFVSKNDLLKEINRLLDLGAMELTAAGSISFTFPLSPGYAGFNKPATFVKFNRAMRAQVAVYAGDYAGALTALAASFLNDDPASEGFSFNTGVFYSYSTGAGDVTNGLFNRGSVFAHPSLQTDAKMQANGMPDQRFLNKITILLDDLLDRRLAAQRAAVQALQLCERVGPGDPQRGADPAQGRGAVVHQRPRRSDRHAQQGSHRRRQAAGDRPGDDHDQHRVRRRTALRSPLLADVRWRAPLDRPPPVQHPVPRPAPVQDSARRPGEAQAEFPVPGPAERVRRAGHRGGVQPQEHRSGRELSR